MLKIAAKRGFKEADRALKSWGLDRVDVDDREMAQKLNFDLETYTFRDGPTPLLEEIDDPARREDVEAALASFKRMVALAQKPAPVPTLKKTVMQEPGSGGIRAYDMASLQKYASSPTAQRLMDARRYFDTGMSLLLQGQFPAAFCALAECHKREEIVAQYPGYVMPLLLDAVKNRLKEDPNDVNALFVNATVLIGARSPEESADIATKCILLDPSQAGFYRFRGCMLSFARQFKRAVRDFDKALEIMTESGDPYRYEMLFLRAASLFHDSSQAPGKARQAFEEYIREAPPDDRKVSEALYQLCIRQIHELGDFEMAKATLERAMEAEKCRLPLFPPTRADCPHKTVATQTIELMQRARKRAPRDCKESVSCAACGEEGASAKCGRCHSVSYCNADCQRAHWKQHKKACKAAPAE
eukprot:tig00020563_g11325.t1